MLSILILVSVYSSVESTDWCPLVKPNGIYKGVGLYHKFDDLGMSEYLMYNKAGHEWKVKIQKDLTLALVDNSEKRVEDRGLLNKFGTFALFEPSLQRPGGRPRVCSVIAMEGKSHQIQCKDQTIVIGSTRASDYVILKVSPKATNNEKAGSLIFYRDSTNKSEYFAFNPFVRNEDVDIDCTDSVKKNSEVCKVPLFVQQMDDSLFTKINAIVDYSIKKGPTGHLILFNIDDKAMYCTTSADQSLSEDCKTPENMKTVFDDCFKTSDSSVRPVEGNPDSGNTVDSGGVPPNEQNANKSDEPSKESSSFGLILVIIIIIVVIIVVVIIVSLVVYNRKGKSSPKKDETKPQENSSAKLPTNTQRTELKKSSVKPIDSTKK